MKRSILLFFFAVCIVSSSAQNLSQDYLDSLEDEELLSLFNELYRDSLKQEKIARTYLDRARKEKDTIKMARGYDRLARIFHPQKNLKFADSLITLTENMDNITYPAMGYIIRAYSYHTVDDLERATENFIVAYDLALENDNLSQQIYVSDFLIFYKTVWGNKKDALRLQFRRNDIVFSQRYLKSLAKDSRKNSHLEIDQLHLQAKILSLQNFSFCYLNLRKLDSARYYANRAMRLTNEYDLYDQKELYDWSQEILMEIEYYDKNYKTALSRAEYFLNDKSSKFSSSTLKNIYLFKGLSHSALGDKNLEFRYLTISDSIYSSNPNTTVQPYDRMLFETLLKHYEESNNTAKRIEFLGKLIKLDSLFKIKYQYFEPEMIKNFETPKLFTQKESLIKNLEHRNNVFKTINMTIAVILLICTMLLLFYVHRQRLYKKRFHILLANTAQVSMPQETAEETRSEISSEIIEEIMQKLNRFEEDEKFREPNISLQVLAKNFGTNSNYLSRVVNLKMEKNFSRYIHDLRIDFAIKELSSNPKFMRYTIKAIAEECGYTNSESFSRAFYRKHGLYPSFYIKQLNKTTNG